MSVQVRVTENRGSKTIGMASVEEEVGGGFDLKKFGENFHVLATASGGVEHLRAMTLHLAIRGALTSEQREGACGPVAEGLNPPFNVPPGWAWRHVQEVGEVKLGRQRAPNNHTGPNMRPYLRVANVHEARIDVSHVLEMNFEPGEAERFLLLPGDVLLNEGQSYELVGRPAIYRGEVPGACFQNTLIRFRPRDHVVLSEFALLVFRAYMRTGRFRQEAQQTTNIAHLSAGRLAVIEFPLPPVAEQKRIVARVDQLMALIDNLDARQTKKREVSARFTRASLDALTSAEGPGEFDAAWKRVVENFPTVIDRAEKVDALRRSILDLAVRAQLVPQDEREGTAQSLIDQCPLRQRDEEAAGRFRPVGRLPEPDGQQQGQIPPSWRWARLGNLCRFIDYRGKTPTKRPIGVRLITAKNVRMGFVKQDPEEFIGPEDYEKWMTRGLPVNGDLLFTTEAPLGNVASFHFSEPIALAQRIITLHPYCDMDGRFLMFVLMSPWFQEVLGEKATGMTATGIKASKLKQLVVPIAPRGEQKRIVAKVEHLMKLCDDLEAKLRRAEDRASKLVEAVVQELVA